MNPTPVSDAKIALDVATFVFPLVCILFGFGMGIVANRKAFALGYRIHVDNHFFLTSPDTNCIFCVEEREWASKVDREGVA